MHRENCNHHISTIFGCGNARPARDELLPISRGMKGVSEAVFPSSLPFRDRPVTPADDIVVVAHAPLASSDSVINVPLLLLVT